MTSRKEPVERRKHERFRVQGDAFAVLGPRSDILGNIIDISEGGLAFRYVAGPESSAGPCELDILCADRSFHFYKIPFETISDFEMTNEVSFGSLTPRRRSVQFRELTPDQTSQLQHILRNYTNGRG
jgi:hypothetical protein